MISVVMPAYNAEAFIGPAIESILSQTYRDLELVVVDDGSTDRTRAIAERFAAGDHRIRIIPGDHQGAGAARNKGLAEAHFPWVAVMDADDVALPERLARQLAAAQADPEVVVWGAAGYHVGPQLQRLSAFCTGPTSKAQFEDMRRRAFNVQTCHSTAFYPRDLALKVGGYDNRYYCEDTEFFDRMVAHGYLLTLPDHLILYREHGDSMTVQKYRRQKMQSRYVSDRQRRRLAGEPPITLEQWAEAYDRAPLLTRYQRWQRDAGDVAYIRARIAFGARRYSDAVGSVALALLVNPGYFIPQIGRSLAAYREVKRA